MKMFDAMDHPLLTDFVRTCVSNSSRRAPLPVSILIPSPLPARLSDGRGADTRLAPLTQAAATRASEPRPKGICCINPHPESP